MNKYALTIVSIVCITILVGIALLKGQNGVVLATSIGMIAGLGGFITGKIKK